MRVDNIFELVNKFSKKEDQISASFGFILQRHPKILNRFLIDIDLHLKQKDLKRVDIETQVPYESGDSRIDLQITLYNGFLVFIESKLYRSQKNIIEQLDKYSKILRAKRAEYDNNIKLVYVNKYPVKDELTQEIRRGLGLSENEFYVFSWEDLIKLTQECGTKETVKLFKDYIGDTMYAKRIIKEQKIKDVVEVLVVYTNPAFWELAMGKGIVVQKNSAPDAKYVVFLRTHRGNRKRSAITHIAEVEYTESHVPRRVSYEGFPELTKDSQKKGHSLDGTHKHYVLGEIIPLAKEIPHLRGEGSKSQVYFQTKLSELMRVSSVGQIRTLGNLEKS